MVIEQALLDELIDHARAEYDAECCGTIGYQSLTADGSSRAVEVRRGHNIHESRKRFEIDGKELLRMLDGFEQQGLEMGAIYHSHTHTEPYPSQTDINFAANWPGLEWVIVGLADEQPLVRCFMIDGPEVREVPLEVR